MTEIRTYNRTQIGGNVVTVETDNTKIVIDFGENLPGSAQEKLEIEGLTFGEPRFDAVFFTHYHGDHIGRMEAVLPAIPLYMGEFAGKTIRNINAALKKEDKIKFLEDRARIRTLSVAKTVTVGDIRVTPYMVGHSAYEAFMFLIETPDTVILHTGDYRMHDYRGGKLLDVIEKHVKKGGDREVDVLITEGTMMSRQTEDVLSEQKLQEWARDFYKKRRHVFLICSSTNFDSLWSFYSAMDIKGGMKMCGSPYVIEQLRTIADFTKGRGPLYQFKEICPFFPGLSDAQKEAMKKNGFVCVIKGTRDYEKWIGEFADCEPALVYSMWKGYLDPNHSAYDRELAAFCEKFHAVKKHTGGHAPAPDVAKVIRAVAPKQAIIPIHTENAAGFYELDIPDSLKEKIMLLKGEYTAQC